MSTIDRPWDVFPMGGYKVRWGWEVKGGWDETTQRGSLWASFGRLQIPARPDVDQDILKNEDHCVCRRPHCSSLQGTPQTPITQASKANLTLAVGSLLGSNGSSSADPSRDPAQVSEHFG